MAALDSEHVFYTRSFAADDVGTAEAILGWRDELVLAGWDGAPIPGAGTRLAVIAELEAATSAGDVAGDADRLSRVERALEQDPPPTYEALTVVEPLAAWPFRWRRLFDRLATAGVRISAPSAAASEGRAPASTDLGLLQARLRGEPISRALRGDGSVLFVCGDTPSDLAELVASMLAASRGAGRESVVVRSLERSTLDAALSRHGIANQGAAEESPWRPAMQVLPLAVELAFEPRDPHRVLELLTLPRGPFRGGLGVRLARALARQPGIGGQEWSRQREHALARTRERRLSELAADGIVGDRADRVAGEAVEARSRLLASWLEDSRSPAGVATREDLLAAAERVGAWIEGGLRGGEVEAFAPAHSQLASFVQALRSDPRDIFSREDARRLVDHYGRGDVRSELSIEGAGRIGHVVHPSALLAPADDIYFWSFVAGVEARPPRSPWNAAELSALESAGVRPLDPAVVLRAEMDAWRRAVLTARQRVVFAVPRTVRGRASAPHPLWDEIRGRLSLGDREVARITIECRAVLEGRRKVAGVAIVDAGRTPLPEGRGQWTVSREALAPTSADAKVSVTALETIATCPLAWVLAHRAGVRSGAMTRIASGALLNGGLGHRLVEILHGGGAFELDEDEFIASATSALAGLLVTEGATLLLPGASIERSQLSRQLLRGLRQLRRTLKERGYRIAAVEEVVTATSAIGDLEGRLDLRLVDAEGRAAVLDLKWGGSSHRRRLQQGAAVQLAVYARALGGAPAGYFAIASGELIASDPRMRPARIVPGPALDDTWRRVEKTARAVLDSHAQGRVHVAAARRSLPLLQALGIPDSERAHHYEVDPKAACEYCAYDALCGRRWGALA